MRRHEQGISSESCVHLETLAKLVSFSLTVCFIIKGKIERLQLDFLTFLHKILGHTEATLKVIRPGVCGPGPRP